MAHRGFFQRLAWRRDLSQNVATNQNGWRANYLILTDSPLDDAYSGYLDVGVPVRPFIYEASPFRYLYQSQPISYLGSAAIVQWGVDGLSHDGFTPFVMRIFSLVPAWAMAFHVSLQTGYYLELRSPFAVAGQPEGPVPIWVPGSWEPYVSGVYYQDEHRLPWPPDVPGGP